MDSDTVNQVKSVYPLDDIAAIIQKSAENGTLVITNKNKADEMLAPIGIQPSQRSRIISLVKNIVSQNDTSTVAAGETKDQLIRFLIENSTDSQKICAVLFILQNRY